MPPSSSRRGGGGGSGGARHHYDGCCYRRYYGVLNVDPPSSPSPRFGRGGGSRADDADNDASSFAANVQRSYKLLSRSFHPDKQEQGRNSVVDASVVGDDTARSAFVQLKTAHDVLVDPVLRLAYDVGGPDAVQLVKRSQQQYRSLKKKKKKRSKRRNDDGGNGNDDGDDDWDRRSDGTAASDSGSDSEDDSDSEDESVSGVVDLYEAMSTSETERDAVEILLDALEEHDRYLDSHSRSRRGRSHGRSHGNSSRQQQQQEYEDDEDDEPYSYDDDSDDDDDDDSVAGRARRRRRRTRRRQRRSNADDEGSATATTRLAFASAEIPYTFRYRAVSAADSSTAGGGVSSSNTAATAATAIPRFEREQSSFNVQFRRPVRIPFVAHWKANEKNDAERSEEEREEANASWTWSHRVEHQGRADLSANVSCEYQPFAGTQVAADARFSGGGGAVASSSSSSPTLLPQQCSVRTTRQLSSRTVAVLAWAGQPTDASTWNWSVVSYRNIDAETLFGSDSRRRRRASSSSVHKRGDKLQALWRIAILPSRRQLAYATASLKNLEFPQYTVRLTPLGGGGPGSFPLKLKYQKSESHGMRASLSLGGAFEREGLWFTKCKVCWMTQPFRRGNRRSNGGGGGEPWSILYGLKYDGRGAVAGVMGSTLPVWTILFRVTSPEWSVKIPLFIDTTPISSATSTTSVLPSLAESGVMGGGLASSVFDPILYGPVNWMICVLIGKWLEQWLDDWDRRRRKKNANRRKTDDATARSPTSQCSGVWGVLFYYWNTIIRPSRNASNLAKDAQTDAIGTPLSIGFSDAHPTWDEAIRRVAAKKRRCEERAADGSGLVILRATLDVSCSSTPGTDSNSADRVSSSAQAIGDRSSTRKGFDCVSRRKDLTDILQFWVVHSRLELPLAELLRGCGGQRDLAAAATTATEGTIAVRYKHGAYVYELSASTALAPDDAVLVLPCYSHERHEKLAAPTAPAWITTTRLGPAGRVS